LGKDPTWLKQELAVSMASNKEFGGKNGVPEIRLVYPTVEDVRNR